MKKEGSQSVSNCNQLKLEATDGKKYLTDVADPKAEPIKMWLAKDKS